MEKYNVTGMTCAACSARVEKAVSKVEGVTEVQVNLLTNSMMVEGTAGSEQIVEAVVKVGYGASKVADAAGNNSDSRERNEGYQSADSLKDTETPKILKRLIASLVFLMPLMYLSMGHMMWNWPVPAFLDGNHGAVSLTQMLLAIIIMVINQKFFISGVQSAVHGAPNMDTLVSLGSAASFGYSVYALYAIIGAVQQGNGELAHSYMHELYFESAAMILALITVGKTLESYSKGRTTDALKSLMKLAPKTATVLRDGKEQIVAVELVSTGDIFVVKPGEAIPVDGIVLEGNSAVDESALTGESIPADKKEGDKVAAATINANGFMKCRATHVGRDTSFSQIIQMVSDAAATKAPIAKIADKVSGVFVPVVLGIAAVTFVIWMLAGESVGFAISRAIAVLVISCPCALGLATPVAIMVGNGVGARNGILFKNAVALENAGKIDIVVMDKTGTLTTGKPVVTDVVPEKGTTQRELLKIAFSLESKSEHPLAKAVVSCGDRLNIKALSVKDFQIFPGNGLMGTIESDKIYGGNRGYIENIASISEKLSQKAAELSQQGKTPLFFAKNDRLLGVIAVADVLKEDAEETVKALQGMGKKVIMLTGDNEITAKALGDIAGVDQVIANVLPGEKEEWVRKLKAQGRVAMVGDGINDAPALTSADVGIAIGAGTDVAIDAADIVLMKDAIGSVVDAVHLSHKVLRNIKENLFWAFFYNVIGIPLAAGAYIHAFGWTLNPMFGAAAMSLSSFCVVSNALRLNFVKMPTAKFIKKKNTFQTEESFAFATEENTEQNQEEKNMTQTLVIDGMMCGHCEAHVKKALEGMGLTAEVSHSKGTAVVTGDEHSFEEYKAVIEEAGYVLKEMK
ncbi:MAG: heavy metal translocating P-type ATPase [Lachnospiraceae bacterium]|nr:heavy metal translocating P-type ATPase [Lachnospiraceae bacterium]